MRTTLLLCITVVFVFLANTGISQQLKLGDNPSLIEKSALLELVSTNQGLLLPRIADTSLINALNPPNGMVIFYPASNKILVRSGGNWQEVVSANNLKLSNLADATINLPASGQLLQYNGSAWVNHTPSYLTSIDTSDIPDFAQKVRGIFSGSAPISINANGQISISQAGAVSDGYLNSSDWNTFNNKQEAGDYMTGLHGDVSATGPGNVISTIASNAVTYSKIQNVSSSDRVLGRVSTGSGIVEEISTTGSGNIVRSNAPVLVNPTGIEKDDVGLGNVDNTSDLSKPISTATQTALNLKINLTEKGSNNGVATLDAGGKVPISQLAVGAQVYKGTWSAATNIPFISDATGLRGDTYRVVESGTINLGSGNITFSASDDVIHNGSIWQRNPATSDVTSVNTQTGTVILTTDNIDEGYLNKYYTDSLANLKISITEKGTNNGVATLDAGGKVPVSQLPVGSQVYKGTWNASSNTPALINGTGTTGWTYRVTVAGTQNLGSGAITFTVGDDIIYNGTIWERNPSSSAVTSVNTQTGTVVLTTDHINEGLSNQYYTDARARGSISAVTPLNYNSTTGYLTLPQASSSVNGYLSAADWTQFDQKQGSGNYITGLTGDVTATGPGTVGATIANNAVTYGKMQAMTANKLLGSGLSGTAVSEITLGTGLTFSGNTLNAATTGGTVTSFSSGNLSPLFTTSVSNATTTPALSFSLNSQSQNLLFASPNGSSGTPTFRSLLKADIPSTAVYNDQSNTYTSGSKQIFSASNINADIRLTGGSADPSTLANGDVWYNSTSHLFKYRANATTRTFANTDEVQTFTNKTISGATNIFTNIGNSSLANSTIGLTLGTTGTDVNVSGTPASLGGSIALNIPSASASNRGLLTAADWNTFNSKGNGSVSSVSVVSANGFGGSVATSTTTPAITINTSVSGLIKGNGTAISAATIGTDYSGGTSALGTGILKSTTGTGTLSIATAGDFPILNQNTTGNAATVTTNANLTGPITSTGNATSVTDLAITTSKLADNTVTFGKMQAMTANKLLGSGLSGTAVSEITLGSGLSFTGTTLNVAGGSYESPLTFSTGLTRSGNTITNNLSTGISSTNQTAIGSTNASGTLTLSSTSHATKGKILFGTSAYDEVNNRLGIGTTSPSTKFTIGGSTQEGISRNIRTGSLELYGGTSEATGAYFQITGDQYVGSPYEGSAEFVIRDLTNSQYALFSYDGASTWTQRFQLKGLTGDTYLIPNGGKVSIGVTTPTANLHLKAGTATASTAPLKFTAGTNMSTPEDGALEYDGSDLFITNGGVRETILTSASANYLSDPGSNGIVARTALNTTTARTITGTTNRITVSNGNGVSGNPTIDVGSNIVDETIANTYTAGAKQTFVSSATTAGLNLTPGADPTTPASGDLWHSTTTANSLKYRDAATTTRTLVDLSLAQSLSNKTFDNTNMVTLKDANFTLQDNTTPTKQAQFQLSAITTGQTRAITLPDANTTMVGTDVAQTLTNKTLTSSTNVLGGVTMTMGSDATGDLYYRNSSGILTRLPIGTSGERLVTISGLPSWESPSTYQATPSDPASTTNTTGRMMGLAGSITPATSGKILITISGDIDNATANSGAQVQIRYGTGSAPANAATLIGTTAGSLVRMVSSSATNRIPFHCNAVVSGLTVGTSYWIDLGLAAITSGTARIRDISISVIEL